MIYRLLVSFIMILILAGVWFFWPTQDFTPLPQIEIKNENQAIQTAAVAEATPLKLELEQAITIDKINDESYLEYIEELERNEGTNAEIIEVINKGLNRFESSQALKQKLDQMRPSVWATLSSGTYYGKQTVYLNSNQNAPIRYTVNGGAASEGRAYTGGITLGYGKQVVRALAAYPELQGYQITVNYNIYPLPPYFDTWNTQFDTSTTVYLQSYDNEPIYYTLNEKVPTKSDHRYTSSGIHLTDTTTITARIISNDNIASETVRQTFTKYEYVPSTPSYGYEYEYDEETGEYTYSYDLADEAGVDIDPEIAVWYYRVSAENRAAALNYWNENDVVLVEEAYFSEYISESTYQTEMKYINMGFVCFYNVGTDQIKRFR